MSKTIWNKEYKTPTFVSKDTRPSDDIRTFVRWLKKTHGISQVAVALDVGCGIGKHSHYLQDVIADDVYAYDISSEAIEQANAIRHDPHIHYGARSIEEGFPLADTSVNLVIDWMTSHLLSEHAYKAYIDELGRVCAPGAFVCLRTFKKEADANASNLITKFSGGELDTYIHPDLGIKERVFSKEALLEYWNLYFDCEFIEASEGYQRWGNQTYKRQYWIAYLVRRK